MDLKKDFIKYLVLVVFILLLGLSLSLWILYIPTYRKEPIPVERKAIILCSANDFYRKDGIPDFNNNNSDSNFGDENNNWPNFVGYPNGSVTQENNLQGHHSPGFVQFNINAAPAGPKYVNMEYMYNWTQFYPLFRYAAYNLSAWVNITSNIYFQPRVPAIISPPGAGARIGLRWLNASNDVVRTDWSKGLYGSFAGWLQINATGVANSTLSEITQLYLVLAVEGTMNAGEMVLFDDIKIEYWFPPPIPVPPPSNTDTDGFPAQALQVYWILKEHGYTDDNIFLMLYHTGDTIIDIYANDGTVNDLTEAVIDVENDDVNSTRFKQELNVNYSGSFASNISSRDQLIIYMVDHGSNSVLGDGNATFHFEADNSYITELDFFNLVKDIHCRMMLINIDICFSGNFLLQDTVNWYYLPKAVMITSTTNIFSWYWRNNNNPDGFAGSWFFHQFWKNLNQGSTIRDAYDSARAWISAGQSISINNIQAPQIRDNLGIANTWSFKNKL